ncbi:hypothetical protein [Streptomyces sp. NPDC090112]|uniref:hypothetical protein n=1 Tax=Streptomyces sp. NPDC090112 TaxID=3365949 RepID=UPI00382DBEE1
MSSARIPIALCLSAAALIAGGGAAAEAAGRPGTPAMVSGPAECAADVRDMQDVAKAVRAGARARDAAATSAANGLLGQQVAEARTSCAGIGTAVTAKVDEIGTDQRTIAGLLAADPTVTDEVLALAVAVPARLADLAALLRDTPTGTPTAE